MKKLFLIIFIFFLLMSVVGCDNNDNSITIDGEDKIEINFTYEYNAFLNGKQLSNDEVYWIFDNDIIEICDNIVTPLREGTVIMTCLLRTDGSIYGKKKIDVIPPIVNSIIISKAKTEVEKGNALLLQWRTDPSDATENVYWSSSDESIAVVDDGVVYGIKEGNAIIKAKCGSAEDTISIHVFEKVTEIKLKSDTDLLVNDCTYLEFNVDDPVLTTESDNVSIIGQYVYGVKVGKATVSVTSPSYPTFKTDFEINVKEASDNPYNMTNEEKEEIDGMIQRLTLEQKVSQFFVLSVDSNNYKLNVDGLVIGVRKNGITTYDPLSSITGDRLFGNFKIIPYNVGLNSYGNQPVIYLTDLTTAYHSLALDQSGVGALIMIDKESIGNCFTNYYNNLVIGTMNDSNACEIQFDCLGKELNLAGINGYIHSSYVASSIYNTADNFSYLEDKEIIYSTIAKKCLENNNVITINNYGTHIFETDPINSVSGSKAMVNAQIPIINVSQDVIENKDIFKAELDKYGYNGVIACTDGYYWYDSMSDYYIQLFKNGVDIMPIILSPSSGDENRVILEAYDNFLEACRSGVITEEELNNALKRVLLMKYRNNLLSGGQPSSNFGKPLYQNEINKLVHDGNVYNLSMPFDPITSEDDLCIITNSFYHFDNGRYRSYNFANAIANKAKAYGFGNVNYFTPSNDDSLYDVIDENTKVVIAIDYRYYNYSYKYTDKEGNTTTVRVNVDYHKVVSKVLSKTNKVIIIFLNDTNEDEYFKEFNKPIIYANGYFDSNFEMLANALHTGVVSGVGLNEK